MGSAGGAAARGGLVASTERTAAPRGAEPQPGQKRDGACTDAAASLRIDDNP